jgi:SAM-dependent methyltransferase
MECKICGNSERNTLYQAREMMLGLRERFSYFQCNKCQCLQIIEIPEDMSKYYPSDYYSYSINVLRYENPIKSFLLKLRNSYLLYKKNWIGSIIENKYPRPDMKSLSRIDLDKKMTILDVGCGNGLLLYDLNKMGFKNTLGVDPYINKEIKYDTGLVIEKKELNQLKSSWDLIMLHHSLEHMSNQKGVFKSLSHMLNPQGTLLVRIPTVSSYCWEKYKENWVSLDAPRHFFLHSIRSINYLASEAGLKITESYRDSAPFQLWGSEQYGKDIPLNDISSHSPFANGNQSVFTKAEMKRFERESCELNERGVGDQVVLYLRKIKYD